jgi:hypothetical protein
MWASLVWLGVVTLGILVVSSALLTISGVTLAGSEDQSWLEDVWQSMLRVLDPGTMASDVGWGRRLLALTVTMFGVLVAGTLIGIIASGVEARIERMRRGRSAVVESDHVVVLGDSERLAPVIGQLVLANAGRGGITIVVLADRDPSELNEEVRTVVRDLRGSRLVFRAGDPASSTDLGLVRLGQARSAIVLSGSEGDAAAVKSVLAIGSELGGFDRIRVVVEVGDPVTGQRLARACGGQVHPMATTQGIARTAAFALRQPGLGQIVEELLDFGGCDLHIVDHRPELIGTTFGSLVHRCANARPIGLARADGSIELAPAPDVELAPDDRLILIADELEALDVLPEPTTPESASPTATIAIDADEPTEQHLLVTGWNRFGEQLLANWAASTTPGSTLEIVVDPTLCDVDSVRVGALDPASVTVSTTPWPPSTVAERVTTILMLAYSDRLGPDETDTRTILDLMLLRRQLRATGRPAPHIAVELRDAANRSLGDFGPDDDVISQAIGTQFLAQLAEQPDRRNVLLALYATDGPSIRLVTADRFGLDGQFLAADVFARASRSGFVAIGWRRRTASGPELVLNPSSDRVVVLDRHDQLVVVG